MPCGWLTHAFTQRVATSSAWAEGGAEVGVWVGAVSRVGSEEAGSGVVGSGSGATDPPWVAGPDELDPLPRSAGPCETPPVNRGTISPTVSTTARNTSTV